jgi:polar amino acid transport system substrate-binding protein
MRLPRSLAALVAVPLLAAVACAPVEEGAGDSPSAGTSTGSTSDSSSPAACAPDAQTWKSPGRLTVGTDSPAYEPWFSDNDPANAKGFESAVAYAVAHELGFSHGQIDWVKVPFNNSYAPGEKKFDFDINQVSITPAREKVVDFSDGYYSAAQAVIALKGSPAAQATSLDELKKLKLGAQTGTTSLTAIREGIEPEQDPFVFDDTNAAKQALNNGQLDAFLADLPTAFYITAVEIPKGTIVGQFQPAAGEQEQFGMLFEKGSPAVSCVNDALTRLKESGELDQIEQRWLSDVVDVPRLQ